MFDGISEEMMDNVLNGISPLCAIEKRIYNGKKMAFNIARSFQLIPYDASLDEYMRDDNSFWRQQYFAQTMAKDGQNEDRDQYGYLLHC